MKEIQNAILKMGADLSGEEFSTLCLAIYEVRASFPEFPQMKEICADIRVRAHKTSPGAVAKSLERAVNRIFEYGDWQVLGTYQHAWLYEQPLPNQFIRTVAMRLWDGKSSPSSEWVG